MSSRHTRRKLAKAKQHEKLLSLAQAARSANVASIVRANKSHIETKAERQERQAWAAIPNCITLCEQRGASTGGGITRDLPVKRGETPRSIYYRDSDKYLPAASYRKTNGNAKLGE